MAKGPAKLTLEIGGIVGASFKKSIKTAQRQLSTFNQNVRRSFTDAAGGATKGFKNVLRSDSYQAAAVAAGGLGLALKGAVTTAMDFEKSMQAVAAVSGATGKDFSSLTGLAKDLGRSTQFSATEAAGAMEMLSMAGLTTEQILKATGPTLNLAAAGAIELSEAADIATNVMGGMGLQVSDLGKINDVLAKTSSSANTNVREMAGVFEKVGGVAPGLGVSLETVSGMAGILANSGLKSAEAGTALRNVFQRLATDTTAKKALSELGVAVADSQGNMRDFPEVLKDVQSQMVALGKTPQEMGDLQKRLFGVRTAAAGGILMQAAANGELAKMIDTVADSEGSAEAQAKTRMQGLAGSMKRLQSALEGLAISFGGPLLGPVAAVAETLAAVASPIAGLLTDMPILGVVAGAAIAAFVGFVVILPIIAAVSGAMAALGITASGMWLAITGPVGLTIAAIIGVIAIFQLLFNKVPAFRKFVLAVVNEVKFLVKQVVKFFSKLPKHISKIVNHIKFFFKNFFKIVGDMWNGFVSFIGNVLGVIGGVIAAGVRAYFRPWVALIDFIKNLWTRLVDWISNLDLMKAGKQLIDNMLKGIQDGWNAFSSWVMEKVNWIKSLNPFKDWRLPFTGGGNNRPAPPARTPGVGTGAPARNYSVSPMARALGGPVTAGRSYLVGEKGPELFTPSASGQILSNNRTAGALSMSPTINITVAESNASAEDIAAAVARGLDDALMEAEAGMRALLND